MSNENSDRSPANGAAQSGAGSALPDHVHDHDHDHPHDHSHDHAHDGEGLDDDIEEINVDITEDGMVWLHGSDFDLVLTPLESRELGQALIEAAADAEMPEE